MNFINYKVIFKGFEDNGKNILSLTFKHLNFKKPINIVQYIIDLKKKSEKNKNIFNFQNIEEVLPIGIDIPKGSFNYYYIILYSVKSDGKKFGFLIGNAKKFGDIVIATWPFNEQTQKFSNEFIINEFKNLVKNTHEYKNICIIN
ncbi:MAG: hypothetical protein ACTSQJ_14765 [Promethearchaeota archaeon]